MASTFDDAKFLRSVERVMFRRLDAVGTVLRNHIREMISTPSRKVTYETKRRKGVYRQVKKLGKRGSGRSEPGNPPHKDYGKLRASISYEVDKAKLVVRVGTPLQYGKFLELGTEKMWKRPYLRRSLLEKKSQVTSILEHGKL